MGKYKINISYRTGDSFRNKDTEQMLELDWEDLDNAKANLQNIKEHYEMYKALEAYRRKETDEEIFDKYKDKPWFVEDKDKTSKKHCILLHADNGNTMRMWAFWTGYFESLYGAEIITDKDESGMSFSIY